MHRPVARSNRQIPRNGWRRAAAVLLGALVLAAAGGGPAAPAEVQAATRPAATDPTPKLRPDLAAIVAGAATPDPRIATLMPGMRAGEVAWFAVLDGPLDATRRTTLETIGARIVRTYRTVDAVALVSDRLSVLRIAALPWVSRALPVEIVVALDDEPLPDQTRGTAGDVSAPESWATGVTGHGVRIAVLDTGHDPLHPDLDDQDFRHWSATLPAAAKVVDARNFNGGGCAPFAGDGHGHGTHVAGIATGTAEGGPTATDDGQYGGVAPGAELAVGKVLTDAGAGLNSDLIAALEWAAMPAETGPTGCAVGADIVNLSLGSEARPTRLNTGSDIDLVSLVLNRLAVRYGTLFVVAIGNSGPYVGSALETPGSAAQALSVAAAAKDWDLNHDDTQSGDTCAGWRHPRSPSAADNDCRSGPGDQPSSVASFSSRGPSGDLWLRPDLAAPGYAIVSAQSSTGMALAGNDLNKGTRADPLYATASGTSMAAPATSGAAALLLEAFRDANGGADPTGPSGIAGLPAPAYALVRAALMNTARGDLYESRWILTTDATTRLDCPDDVLDQLDPVFCQFADLIGGAIADVMGSVTLYEVRNGAADPYVGPLAEGAGKLDVARAAAALTGGVVIYSAASGSGGDAGTGPRDLQGTWQVGAIAAGSSQAQDFVVRAAPGTAAGTVTFAFVPGSPSDGSSPIPASWSVQVPASIDVPGGGAATVTFRMTVPSDAAAGTYTGVVVARAADGTRLRLPVFASVALHDAEPAAGSTPGAQAAITSERDVFAKDDTVWPSVAGAALGATADWRVYAVDLAAGLGEARFAAVDTDHGDETYDLYVYDARFDLLASSHPFAAPGVSDAAAQRERGPSTASDPATVVLHAPAAGRHYVAVNRARIGRGPADPIGDMGSFRLTLDEVAHAGPPGASAISYEGDHVFLAGSPGRLAARLTTSSGAPIAGREVVFTFDGTVAPCPGGRCAATTDVTGLAQLATEAIQLAPGVHEVTAAFGGDAAWQPASVGTFALVVGSSLPPIGGGGGHASGGGWFVRAGAVAGAGDDGRIHVAFDVASGTALPTGALRYRDRAADVDLADVAWTSLAVDGGSRTATATGRATAPDGAAVTVELTVRDVGEPGRRADTIRLRILAGPGAGYDRSGVLGGGNLQVRAG